MVNKAEREIVADQPGMEKQGLAGTRSEWREKGSRGEGHEPRDGASLVR